MLSFGIIILAIFAVLIVAGAIIMGIREDKNK